MGIRVVLAVQLLPAAGALRGILAGTGGIEVVGEALDGGEAVRATELLRPDLVIMDRRLTSPVGMNPLEEIMALCPTPVLLLAPDPEQEREGALMRGALDVMEPPGDHPEEGWAERVVEKVRLLSGIKVIRHHRRRNHASVALPRAVAALGASTGGPKVVMRILQGLPIDFGAPLFLVQHIAEGCAAGFARWLDRETPLRVKLARDGGECAPGEVLVAPDRCHLILSGARVRLLETPPVNCCRPSIDVFFASLAREHSARVVAALLSGMGRDGAQGLQQIREQGGRTMVQDERSCAIFGMPRAALALDPGHQVLPADRMAAALVRHVVCLMQEPT